MSPFSVQLLILLTAFAILLLGQLNHRTIMSKLSELESQLNNINATLEKARAEIVAAVAELQRQIAESADPELPAAAQASLDRLTSVAASLDALNPDTPPEQPNV